MRRREDWESEKYGQRRGQSTWFLRNMEPEQRWGTYAQKMDNPNMNDADGPTLQWEPDVPLTGIKLGVEAKDWIDRLCKEGADARNGSHASPLDIGADESVRPGSEARRRWRH